MIASNTDQCVTSRKVEVKVRIRDIDRIIFVPNAFTPNGDHVNDLITVFGSPLLQSVLQFDVYDRWGNLAFRKLSFNPNEVRFGWDGSSEGLYYSGGTFVYVTRVQFIDGSIRQFQRGFHLIR
ncbi:MAG: gliding motility-associated C-terminal domain-containing protein [Saprospiraceae bacterium]|nr:gliding motility-associated C-terminal domain-containing protein [Saprospiraceae bacterium]